MNQWASDTIVAASSPAGRGARGLVRLSGPDCTAILRALGIADLEPRLLTITAINLPPRLPVLAARFAAPASYTAQDMAELQLPGHPAVIERVIHRCVEHGARLAEPGEFTFRAFLAGKLDLTQAEGVAATIAAQSEGQLQAAAMLSRGHLGQFAQRWVDRLADALALVEAGIDFTDQEDVTPIAPAALADRLAGARVELEQLLSRSRSWGALEALPRVVLVGAPSTGKSTLFNALLGRTRAVVSAMPGTTRDILAEPITLRSDAANVEVMLVDIAGLDTPQGALDHAVQAAARQAIESADLLLAVRDHEHSPPATPDDKPTLAVRTKADLSPRAGERELAVSVHEHGGLAALRAAIAKAVGERGVSVQSERLALQPRHQSALRSAAGSVRAAVALVEPQRGRPTLDDAELIAAHLRAALDDLASLGGQMTPDDIIGRVFATFCVGK